MKENKNIILVGGTGLYLKAALFDYRFVDENEVEEINLDARELRLLVREMNPDTTVDFNNLRRLTREYINLKNGAENKYGNNLLYDNVYFIGLETSRDILYERINKRVDQMIKNGLLDEAKYFYNLEETRAIMTPIGYKELFKYFDKEISLEEAIDLIKKNSRHYAKRQYTWFNNKMNIKWFNVNFDDFNQTINEVINYIKKRK